MNDTDIDKPLYTIEEESESTLYQLDDDPPGTECSENIYDEVDIDEDEDDEEIEDSEVGDETDQTATVEKSLSPAGVIFKTMFTPVEGWKALKRARFSTESFAARSFYPLIGICAVAQVTDMFYEANVSVADWAKNGLATFMTFFFGYFTAVLIGGVILPSKSRDILKKEIGKQFVMLAMSTLVIFQTILQFVPMFDPVLVFLPLWTIYLVYKGVRILRVPKEVENSTTGLLCMLIIGVPLFWNWIVTEILFPLSGR